jgi:hypothetical protein
MPSRRAVALRALRWLVVVLPVADLLLVRTGAVPVRQAVLATVVVEVLALGVLVTELAVFRSAYRAARADGQERGPAALAGVGAALPRPVAFVVRTEAGMAQALWWAVRRRRCVRPGETPFPYTDRIAVMLWTTVGVSLVEVTVVHLAVPVPVVRWVLLAVSGYGLLWLVAFAFSLRQRPHTLDDEALTLRFGHVRSLVVPLAVVATATASVEVGHRRNVETRGGRVVLSVMGETGVELRLHPDTRLELGGAPLTADRVAFFADDPRGVVRALRARQGADR